MMIKQFLFFIFALCLFFRMSDAWAEENASLENKNILIVKNMFSEFAEKKDINKLDLYYTKSFVLESNGKKYDYTEYKNLEGKIYRDLKSLTVKKYDDIFSSGNKVVARMKIKLIKNTGQEHEFYVFLIALIKDAKIDKIWELTYPSWSDKLTTS